MSVEINSAMVAKIADSYLEAPRLACGEFQAIVSAFQELHSEFTTRVEDASSEYLEDHIELHHSDAYYNLLTGSCYRDLDEDVLSAMWDHNYQELVESLSQHVKEQIFSKARSAASEHCNTRAIEIACRGELFCRAIEMATMEKADPIELVGTSRLRTIVCEALIPIGHSEWWKTVFEPDFKYVEANFRTFTDRVAYKELKARAPAGGKKKRTPKVNAKGSQTEKLVSYLSKHHDYENCRVGNYFPAESADIARESKAKPSTVSDFLKREFPCTGSPRTGYVQACTNEAKLLHWFMVQFKDNLPARTANIDTYNEADIRDKS